METHGDSLRLMETHGDSCTVSLSRVWLNDEMNPGNDYYSSPDQYMGNQKAQKIEKSTGLIWRKLRLKYEMQLCGKCVLKFI